MNVAMRKLKYRFRPPNRTEKRRVRRGGWAARRNLGGIRLILILILCAGLAGFGFHRLEARIDPVVQEMAISKINGVVTIETNQAVQKLIGDSEIQCGDLLKMQNNDSGTVTSLTADFSKLNELKSQLAVEIQNRINQTDHVDISVPVGAFVSDNLMSGFGVKIPVRMISTQSIRVDFHDEFEDAGINQTRHRLMIVVKAPVTILSASSRRDAEIATEVPIAETIIVGNVPGTYLNLGE